MCCLTLQVLAKEPCPGEPGEALLAEVLDLVSTNPDNQALMCLQARQLMQLDRMGDTLQTVSGFVGVGSGVAPSRWALHVTVHVRWLIGGLDQVWLTPHPFPEAVSVVAVMNVHGCCSRAMGGSVPVTSAEGFLPRCEMLGCCSGGYVPHLMHGYNFVPHDTMAMFVTAAGLQMVESLKLLVTTNPSPLEEGVDYTVPDNSVLSALLNQLEHLQALWQEFHR